MLKQLSRALVLALAAGLAVLAPPVAGPALADCRNIQTVDDFGNVTIIEECDDEVETPGTGEPGASDPDGDAEPRVCRRDPLTIVPCVHRELGSWTDAGCWAKAVDPPPAADSPLWEGNTDGYVVQCVMACSDAIIAEEPGALVPCAINYSWSADPPAGVPTGPSAQELAQRAVNQMRLTMGEIGSTPPSREVDAASVGLVGTPVWLWISDPAENTTGPITRTASGGPLTVTATGTLDRIEWELADASGAVLRSTTCSGAAAAGTPWSASASDGGREPSPTCGFTAGESSRAGRLTLTGTAYWTVEWTSTTQSGTVDVPPQSRSAELQLAEVQVITR